MTKTELKTNITMVANAHIKLAVAHYRLEHAARKYPVVHRFDLRGKTAGMFRWGPDGLVLRWHLEAAEKYTEDYIESTVPHEVAHYVVHLLTMAGRYGARKVQPHGREWREVMGLSGADPARCHSYDLTPARRTRKFQYQCSCRVYELGAVRHGRIMRGDNNYFCPTCRTRLTRVAT